MIATAFRSLVVLLWAGIAFSAHAAPATPVRPNTIFVSTTFVDVAHALATDFNRRTGKTVRPVFDSSAGLARDLEGGATPELILLSDAAWMDYLVRKKVVARRDRYDRIGSRMVLVAPMASRARVTVGKDMPLLAALGAAGKLAIANVDTVAAGRAGRAALQQANVWNAVRPRAQQVDSGRAAVLLVGNNQAAFAVVPENDARLESRVKVLGAFPSEGQAKLVYPLAVTRHVTAVGNAFLAYLQSREAANVLARFGFVTF